MTKRVALYIDADNISFRSFERVSSLMKDEGDVIIKNVYGDWGKPEMKSWRTIAIRHGLTTKQCISLARKNSTDIFLIVDLLTDLYEKELIDTFILVTSDSDFTHVAKRIREKGKKVIGIGNMTTPLMLQNACHQFCHIDEHQDSDEEDVKIIPCTQTKSLEYIHKRVCDEFKRFKSLKVTTLKRKCSDLKTYIPLNDWSFFEQYLFTKYPDEFRFRTVKSDGKSNVCIYYIKDVLAHIKTILNHHEENMTYGLLQNKLTHYDSSLIASNFGFTTLKEMIKTLFSNEFECTKTSVHVKDKTWKIVSRK